MRNTEEVKNKHIAQAEEKNKYLLSMIEKSFNNKLKVKYAEVVRMSHRKRDTVQKKMPRGVRFTDHALQRFQERMSIHWYSVEDIINDIKKWWKCVRDAGQGEYQLLGQLGKYIFAKDRVSHDWIIITVTLSVKQKEKLWVKE